MIRFFLPFLMLFTALLFPELIFAHAFGQTFNLSLPLWMYLYGGGLAVLISFLIIGFFFKKKEIDTNKIRKDLSGIIFIKFIVSDNLKFFLKFLSLGIFLTVILSGFLGSILPTENFATLFIWIVFLLGCTYLVSIIGNFWEVINPWKIIIEIYEYLKGGQIKALERYPKRLGFIPALIFYFLFIWLELSPIDLGTKPTSLATLLIFYSIFTLIGIFYFGRDWFLYGEFFSVLFILFGKNSILESSGKKFFLRLPFSGLLNERIKSFSLVIFIVLMLASTAFDGFRATSLFLSLSSCIFRYLPNVNLGMEILIQTLFLVMAVGLFLAAYLIAIYIMKLVTKSKRSFLELAQNFGISLVPIALVYNAAHYYTLLLVQGQAIIPVLSDPFNLGWNLFGTTGYMVNIGIIGARAVWESEVYIILFGHIASVFVSHLIALKVFPSHKSAIISQIPMLVLMVSYTILGLWILSQPLGLK